MNPKQRLSQNLTNSVNKLKLDSINKILKIDSAKGKKRRRDAISKQVSRIALAELMKNSPQASHIVAPDFKAFLMHDDNIEVFEEFLQASYCKENLDFYLACERYRKLDPDRVGGQMIKFMATQIFNDFLADDARQPINVNSSCIDRIRANLKNPQPDLLRDAQAEIFNLLKTDCYPRFCKTWQLDKEMAQKIVTRNNQSLQTESSQVPSSSSSFQIKTRSPFVKSISSRDELFNGSCLSRSSASRSTNRSHDSTAMHKCPPECPYFRVGRLPCQQHAGIDAPNLRTNMGAQKRGPECDKSIDHVIDLKRIHQVPKLDTRNKRSPPPPPLPPKPDDIDYTLVRTNKRYLPYVGKVFEV